MESLLISTYVPKVWIILSTKSFSALIIFRINFLGAGLGQVEVIILDPKGKPNTAMMRIRQLDDDNYRCEYVAQDPGKMI